MKLYKMKTRLYKKLRAFHGGYVNEKILKIKVGDLLHDCDGFNHRVKSIEFFKLVIDKKTATCWNQKLESLGKGAFIGNKGPDPTGIKPRKKQRYYIIDHEILREDGSCFCGCGAFPEEPKSRDEIEKYVLSWDNPDGWETINQGTLDGFGDADNFKKMVDTLKSGEHICDEDGILLDEFRQQQTEKEN